MLSTLPPITAPSQFKRQFINLIFLLNLFPFFKFIPFITAEVQPISGLFGALFLLLFKPTETSRYYRWAIPYFFTLTGYFLIAIVLVFYGEVDLAKVTESLAIFLSPLFTFLALLNNLDFVSVSVFRFAFYAWAIVSFCQQFAPAALNASGVSFLLTLLIPRFSSESLAAWNRGVVAFAPEPSYGAHIILLMLAFAIFLYRQQKIGAIEFSLTLLVSLMMVYTNQSATLGFILLIFFIVYGLLECLRGGKSAVYVVTTASIFIFFLFIAFSYFPEVRNIRLFEIFFQFFDMFTQSSGEFNAIEFTNSQGSNRTISVQVGYANLFLTHGFGSGLGGWSQHFIDSMEKIGIKTAEVSFFRDTMKNEVVNIKPYAYGAMAAFDLGFFGLGTFSLFFIRLVIARFKQSAYISSFSLSCFISALLGIYYNSPSSLPVYWIFFLFFFEAENKRELPNLLVNNLVHQRYAATTEIK